MFGFGSLRGVPPQVAAEVRQRLQRLVLPVRPGEDGSVPGRSAYRPGSTGAETPELTEAAAADGTRPDGTGPDVTTGVPGPDPTAPSVPRLRRAHLVVVATLLALALVAALVVVLRRTPVPEPLPEPSTSSAIAATAGPDGTATPGSATFGGSVAPSGPSRTTSGAGQHLLVHVVGKVRDPGVVRLPVGSRVVDALEAAGGAKPRADLGTVNLARPLRDGEQVLVDTDAPPRQAAQGGGGIAAGSEPSPGPIDLNSATLPELEQLPGIGPALGQRILDFREEHGGFTSVQQLHEVSGIGERRFAELSDRVLVR